MDVSGQLHAPADLFPWIDPPALIRLDARWRLNPAWTRWRREKAPSLLEIGPRSTSP